MKKIDVDKLVATASCYYELESGGYEFSIGISGGLIYLRIDNKDLLRVNLCQFIEE